MGSPRRLHGHGRHFQWWQVRQCTLRPNPSSFQRKWHKTLNPKILFVSAMRCCHMWKGLDSAPWKAFTVLTNFFDKRVPCPGIGVARAALAEVMPGAEHPVVGPAPKLLAPNALAALSGCLMTKMRSAPLPTSDPPTKSAHCASLACVISLEPCFVKASAP